MDANVGQSLYLLLAFKNTKTSRHSEIKQTSPSTKQDFSEEALSKQNTEASPASLSWLVPGDDRVVRHICIRCITKFRCVHMRSRAGPVTEISITPTRVTGTKFFFAKILKIASFSQHNDTSLCSIILVLFLGFHPSRPGWSFPYQQTRYLAHMKKP